MSETSCGFSDDINTGLSGQDILVSKGPTLFVDIGFDKDYDPKNPAGAPKPDLVGVSALVDTGATQCCIDNLVAQKLNLPIVDKQKIAGVGGKHEVNMYLAQVHVPDLDLTMWGSFVGVDLAAGGQIHNALLGRTFLRGLSMIYDGSTGTVKISK